MTQMSTRASKNPPSRTRLPRHGHYDSPLIIHTECSDGWGGQEIRILGELRGMRLHGYAMALISPSHSQIFQRAKAEGFPVYHVRFGTKGHLPSWVALMKLIARLRPTVVNTHSSDDSWMAGFAARLLRVPLIIRTRHVSTPIGSTFSYRHFPHLILTTSSAIRSELIERGLEGRKIVSMPTGIDPERFRFEEKARRRIRKLFGISGQDVLVGNICVLRSWKGLDFFIETAERMSPSFKFILVGDGPQRLRLMEKVKGKKLESRLFFPGHEEQVEDYFSALDIFFFTSYASEGVPQSLLQAMSVGLPLVFSRTPSVMETLEGYGDAIPIEYGDVRTAREALEETARLHHPNDSNRSARRRYLQSKYDIRTMWHQLAALYRHYGIPAPPKTDLPGSPAHRMG